MILDFPYTLIDLTHTLDSSIPTWNGLCGFQHDLSIDYPDCTGAVKFRVMKMKMQAGIGTHIDAPSHCIESGRCIHDFDVNELCMPCVVIDIADRCHERYSLTLEDVAEFESQFGPIVQGSCVMIKTGWSKFWEEPSKYHNNYVFPSVSFAAAEVLLECGAHALGIDTLSPDRPEDGFEVHQVFLRAGKILIENVTNLDLMPPVGAFVMVLPIKVKHGTEAPVRLVGLIRNYTC